MILVQNYTAEQSWLPVVSRRFSEWAGRASTCIAIILLVAAGALAGPLFDYSETWQLMMITATTLVNFLMIPSSGQINT